MQSTFRSIGICCAVALIGCSSNSIAPQDTELSAANTRWLVHCESSLKPLPKAGENPETARPKGWIAARTPNDFKIELLGRLEDGFVQVTGVATDDPNWSLDPKQPYQTLRKVCRNTMAGRKKGQQYRPGLVRTSRSETGVYTSFVFDEWAERDPIPRLVVFGDSLSDTGKLRRSLKLAPRQPYWVGRFANGPIWVDYLEVSAGIAVQNHARGGAMVAQRARLEGEELRQRIMTNGQFFVSGSISHQIGDYAQRFLQDQRVKHADSTVAVLWAGANDYISKEALSDSIDKLLSNSASDESYRSVVSRVVEAMQADLVQLKNLGLKRFLVINLPDLGLTPLVLHNSSFQAESDYANDDERLLLFASRLTELTRWHNDALAAMLGQFRAASPGVELILADADATLEAVLDPELGAEEMGFDLLSAQVLLSDEHTEKAFQDRCYSGMTLGVLAQPTSVCADGSRLPFWDLVHPSTFLHCWMAYSIGTLLQQQGWIGPLPDRAEYRAWCELIADAY